MYSFLIADDEFYSRKGLIRKITSFFPDTFTIYEAENGEEGLNIANAHVLDVVLSDVRMPRMDGIAMCRAIREKYPDCVILFLSGFSDKNYLYSAIDMKAIKYLDKPIQDPELQSAFEEVLSLCQKRDSSQQYRTLTARRQLCLALLEAEGAGHSKISIDSLLKQAGVSPYEFCDSFSIVFQLLNGQSQSASDSGMITPTQCLELLGKHLSAAGLNYLCTIYHHDTFIIHVLSSPVRMASAITKQFLTSMFRQISGEHPELIFFAGVGDVVSSYQEIFHSYNSAVIYLQRNFFLGRNTVSFPAEESLESYQMSEDLFQAFQQSILHEDETAALGILRELTAAFEVCQGSLISVMRENYFRILSWLYYYASSRHNTTESENSHYLWELIASAYTLSELELVAANYIKQYFQHQKQDSPVNRAAESIKALIEQEYGNPELGIPFLSSRLNLSSSYISYLFKQNYQTSVNPYILQVRIAKATEMLMNTNKRINDISDECGFSNQNYFAKTFRRVTGFSPSEYRDSHGHGSVS